MPVNRRDFLESAALAAAGLKMRGSKWVQGGSAPALGKDPAYGSGYFGRWIEDEFGLPAFNYTCDQIHDAKAKTDVNPGILAPTEQHPPGRK